MRKSVTLPTLIVKKIESLAVRWDVHEAEAMRRILGLGAFFAEEILEGHEILYDHDGNPDTPPRSVRFPELEAEK